MTILPIAGRELRVSARRPLTYWGRLGAAALALIIFGTFQLIASAYGGMGFNAGQLQFAVLKWMAFIFACGTGIFLTADSLSEEKREGTLGLLFLTDLRGYDVVFGKLISHSLQASYGLLAVFPVLGLTMLAGGVAGAEFARIVLIICNTVFLSLAIGLFVSSLSRDSIKAMNGTLLVILVFLLGLPMADIVLAGGNSMKFKAVFSLASPGYLFMETGAFSNPDYWTCLAVQHALAWGVLVLSCVCVPRAWQEKSAHPAAPRPTPASRWRFGGSPARLALRRKLLDKNPVLWLAMRDRRLPRLVWLITALLTVLTGWQVIKSHAYLNSPGGGVVGSFRISTLLYPLQSLFVLVLTLWVAFQASRLFVEGVRNGALELLLVTPVTPRHIVHAQWKALLRTFLVPAILAQVFFRVIAFLQMHQVMTATNSAGYGSNYNWVQYLVISPIVGIVEFLATLAALGWFGMCMGLTSRKPVFAVLKSLCFVSVLPWIAMIFIQLFAQILLISRVRSVSNPWLVGSLMIILNAVLSLGKDAFFIVLARRRLLTGFREAVAQAGQRRAPLRNRLPLPMPPVHPGAANMERPQP
jgi:ABC-type transport system involved in cytochrome c biogenesis permease component